MENKVEVFVCKECGYEDSSIIPMMKEDEIKCPHCKREVKRNIVLMEYGDYMLLAEYIELLAYIEEEHSFKDLKGKMIKYVRHSFDMRTNTIYEVTLNDKKFSKINENRHRDLLKWIYEYLDN